MRQPTGPDRMNAPCLGEGKITGLAWLYEHGLDSPCCWYRFFAVIEHELSLNVRYQQG
jgi:hypothetical protein